MGMTCFTKWQYVGAGDYAKAKALTKYIQYRESREQHVSRAGGPDRWVDCGLGRNWREAMASVTELQSDKVLLRSLVIRPPQEELAQLEEIDPERWANRRELLGELVHRVMDAEMQRAGVERPDGSRDPLDLPYSYVIHAPKDSQGLESLHAHVIVPAFDRDRERPFNVYPKDVQHTRDVAERETERLFELSRVHEWQPELKQEQERGMPTLEREIPFFDIDL